MKGQPIEFFHRANGRVETEAVYGEGFLRWTYESPTGRVALWAVARRHLFSKWFGWRMSRRASRARIEPFIREYGLDPGEFADDVQTFASFNDFFARALKPETRPIDPDPGSVVFPADGRHLALADIAGSDRFFVKGQRFDVACLLGSADLGERFARGSLVLSRLCPVDYHRFHFPCDGQVEVAPRRLPGPLYSVSPIALRRRLDYLWENERIVTLIETADLGQVAMVEVGATCVGTIVQTATLPGAVQKGAEKGMFRFGGSSVVTVFEPGRVALDDDLLDWSSRGIELYARVGDRMGVAPSAGS